MKKTINLLLSMQDEAGALAFMVWFRDFEEKTLILADRGYESYNMFAYFLERPSVDLLIRVKQDRSAKREIDRRASRAGYRQRRSCPGGSGRWWGCLPINIKCFSGMKRHKT